MTHTRKQKKTIITICLTTFSHTVFSEGFFNVCKGIEDYSNLNQIVLSSTQTQEEIMIYNFKQTILFKYSKGTIFGNLKSLKIIINRINIINPDYILFYGENPFHSLILLLLSRKITVFTHIVDPVPHSDSTLLLRNLYLFSKLNLIIKSNKLLFASENVRTDFIKYYNKYFNLSFLTSKARIMILANLFSIQDFVKNTLYKENTIAYTFIFFGRIVPYKNLELLIDAFEILNKTYKINLLICGQGKLKRNINNKNIIQINKYLSYEKLLNLISKSKAVVLPYKDASGTHTIQIANSLGVPVIVSNVGCFVDYVSHNINGLIFSNCNINSLVETMKLIIESDELFSKKEILSYNTQHFSNETITNNLLLELDIS